jgi:hypothetical protein
MEESAKSAQSVAGKYRHYKGKFYEVIDTAIHSETLERLVVYRALYDSKDFPKDQLWVRPEKMFNEIVLVDGKEMQRFKHID